MILFAYHFPHKKTQDFIFYSQYYNFKIDAVIASPYVDLKQPPKKYPTNIQYIGLIDPLEMCFKLGIPYYVAKHNSSESLQILENYKPKLGLISGARLLSTEIIRSFSKGIINFHPGLIPEARGVDTLQWIIYDSLPMGVTSHFIDHRVDAGRIIERKELPRYKDDTLKDISLRLYHGQLEIFRETITRAKNDKYFERVQDDVKRSYGYFPTELEDEMYKRFLTTYKNTISFGDV
jgi:phosphoribosylglycinamide formyltransferase-1